MLIKESKPAYKRWIKRGAFAIFAGEAICFAVSYKYWTKLNSDRDSRKYLKDNYPILLEYYYKTGEYLDPNSRIRQTDHTYWLHQN